jgi:heme exporter protein D
MNFGPLNFDMGAYGAYIWPAYGVSALALIGVTLWTVSAWRRAKSKLAELEKKNPLGIAAPEKK